MENTTESQHRWRGLLCLNTKPTQIPFALRHRVIVEDNQRIDYDDNGGGGGGGGVLSSACPVN